jgi:hypothetical protein
MRSNKTIIFSAQAFVSSIETPPRKHAPVGVVRFNCFPHEFMSRLAMFTALRGLCHGLVYRSHNVNIARMYMQPSNNLTNHFATSTVPPSWDQV